ncbi:ribonuclease R [Alcanivorax sp. 521-1]|uniref:Ribonuclease R n=1 Tax=Alloalcanivorax profundimaris TaxID=2735259 RepID=A0ABS0AQW4_9GAMM|nr:ribonuclease R [Alloalcanivorax profundimaris]MBF5056536.1 ribonuclease R [Alloalcanivorax profundimaris]
MSRKRYKDPHADREAEKYENPVPSRELILKVLDDQGKPLGKHQLADILEVGEDGEVGLERRLKAMLRDGQLVENRNGKVGIASRMDLIAGRVQAHRDGFGFLIADEAGRKDLFLAPRQMQKVMDGDRVLVSVAGFNRFGKEEARIVEIAERAVTEIVGRYRQEAGVAFIDPENRRITKEVLVEDHNGIKPGAGDHVRAEITQYPSRDHNVLVRLEEIIATPEQPGMEVDVALRRFEIPHQWPDGVEQDAERFGAEVPHPAKAHRVDLRDLPLVTIDGEDARDFDDAVYVERRKRGGWRLIVAIADVSHYVHPNSPLDNEAHKRGNSVYFPNRVVPMLPEALSNGLCSLNPHVDRLCLYCDMLVSANGRVSRFVFREGVMRSRHRLTYTKVGAVIEEPESPLAVKTVESLDDESLDSIWAFHEMYTALRERRELRGAIDFESDESRILYDEHQKIRDIVPVHRNVAHVMIEEAMLAANICAARLLEKAGVPTLFRNHEPPKEERLANLQQFLGGLGLSLAWSEGALTPKVFQELGEAIAERPDRQVIQTMMLRTMTQAKYEAEVKGHFGLAYNAYTHFTSPIRRYPDLLVHRAIRYLIRGGAETPHADNPGELPAIPKDHILPYSQSDMVAMGEHCSMTERRADEATRDVVQWLKCQYMEDHLGEEFDGVVSGVAAFGLFIQIQDLHIDGLVHVANLDSDYYHFDDVNMALIGESSGRRFSLGDGVRVKVAGVHTDERKIDLELISSTPAKGRRGGGKKKAASRKKKAPARQGGKSGSDKSGSEKGGSEKAGSEREKLARGEIPKGGKGDAKGDGKGGAGKRRRRR